MLAVAGCLALGCGDDGSATSATDAAEGSSSEGRSTGGPASSTSDASGMSTDVEPTTGVDGSSSSGEPPPDDPGDPFGPVPPFEPLGDAAVAQLGADLDAIVDGGALAGSTRAVLVVDLETDQVLYERNADTALVPASNTKMFTTAATVDILSPDTRVVTEIWADAEPDGAGAIAGDLHLMGQHDFSWATDFYASARTPLDRMAASLYDAGVRSIAGDVVARGEFCYEGQSLGEYDAVSHRGVAAVRFRDALEAAGISVGGSASSSPGFEPPAGTTSLLQWRSPPLSSMSTPVNVRSHNEFADVMLRHLGLRVAGESTYTAGGSQIVDWMASLPTDNGDAVWNDGSGLSHGNRTSTRNLVDLLRFMTAGPAADRWMRTMAIAGVRGTLTSRMTGGDTVARFWGKTGTLPSIGVVSLSGVLFHRYDGRRYAISILLNGVDSVDTARAAQNQIVEAVATDRHAVGGRPASPELIGVRAAEDSTVVELEWTPVEGADGYAVWVSPDAESWRFSDVRGVDGTTHRAGELPFEGDVYFRVTAFVEEAGAVHSIPTDVYAATSAPGAARILIVDGNDRWQAGPVSENPRGVGHGFVARYAEALPEHAFDTVSNEAVAEELVALDDYDVVLWMLGEEGEVDRSFDDLEQSVVRGYVEGGGAMFVSGAELGYDLGAVGTPEDAAFFADVFEAAYAGDDAGTWWLSDGEGPFVDAPALGFNTRDAMVVDFPDQLTPLAGATGVLSYWGGLGGVGGVASGGDSKTIVLGVPFESIEGADDRRWVMERALSFLR